VRVPRLCRLAADSLCLVRGDGNGWVVSATGNRYWGRFGAAGLLLRAPAPDGATAVLLQRRAVWSHQGGTWGLPGGARDSHETPEQAALRETYEETGVRPEQVAIAASAITAAPFGTRWTYTTVLADAADLLPVVGCAESAELRWVIEEQVTDLRLHPGLADSWQRLRDMLALTSPAGVPS
jgi:8-oxo-dGTP diphosphatase